ncbi:MAG: hypothetical protein ABL967_12695 [Bryobacteraceae bacterium]
MFEQSYNWLLRSGIQEASGGVARYYLSDKGRNLPVSTEITGYYVSGLVHLRKYAGAAGASQEATDAVLRSARYLTHQAWDETTSTMPFEVGSGLTYFFDTGIIVRGLLAAWAATKNDEFAERAKDAALSLAFDFLGDSGFHPIVTLPDKQPLEYDYKRWSRSPGCYQLKSAMAWKDIGDAFSDEHANRMFEQALEIAMDGHEFFLPGVEEPERVMDRLHAFSYFLEALLSVGDRKECREALESGIERVGYFLREIGPTFERSDVCAQLLRVRLAAHHLHGIALDDAAAADEAARAASYQAKSDDVRIHGGFWFGKKGPEMLPFVNPVSTVFCMQALGLWQDHRAGNLNFAVKDLI